MKGSLVIWPVSVILICAAMGRTKGPASSTASSGHSIERGFAAGGDVRMYLSAGEYVIRASQTCNNIRVQWTAKKPEQGNKAKVDVDVRDSHAAVTAYGPKGGFRVDMELPARTDLFVRMRSGDIDIKGIEGNMNIDCRTGDINIDVGKTEDYKRVGASVHIGDLEAPPFNISKGGFFRSFQWDGEGKYTLYIRLRIGSITLLGPGII